MSNFSPFPKYVHCISNFRSQIAYFVCEIRLFDLFSSGLQILYAKVWISRSISERLFDFDITPIGKKNYMKILN